MSPVVWPYGVAYLLRNSSENVMALHHSSLSVCTFNCRSVKNCLPEIHKLCDTHYFILLQEHWLLPFELNTLNNILPGCLFHGLSAVGVTSDVLSG